MPLDAPPVRNPSPGARVRRGHEARDIRPFWTLSAAGFAATAISYGPARMGFGLFVPEFRDAFSMSTAAVGYVSSLGFLGFFVGLLGAQALLARRGPELPVLTGLGAATAGLGIVALAPGLPVLAIGVFLAMSSAGFAWTPFNNAVHRTVRDGWRPEALSAISTGTGIGIAAAGFLALAMVLAGLSWRLCWALFAAASGVAFVGNWAALRKVDGKAGGPGPASGWRSLLQRTAVPLYAIAFAYGTTSAIYISFAGDHMVEAGGVPGLPAQATPAVVFVCYGLSGLVGFATAGAKARVGLPWLLRLLMLAGALSVVLVALAPGRWAGLIVSAGLQGMHVMMTSAVLAFWSERLFPERPSLGFTAALLATATGSVLGPALAGVASGAFGAAPMLYATAALPALTAAALRDRHARERPAEAPRA